MLRIVLFICSAFLISVHVKGELTITYSPEEVRFEGHNGLKVTQLKDVLSAVLGYTVHKESKWRGLSITSPFGYASAVVAIVVDGINHLKIHGKEYPLKMDASPDSIREALIHRTQQRYSEQNPLIVNLDLDTVQDVLQQYPQLFNEVSLEPEGFPLRALNTTVEADKHFLSEMQLLKEVARKVSSGSIDSQIGKAAGIFWFPTAGLHALIDIHGSDSVTVMEAKLIIREVVSALTEAFRKAYKDKVVVAVITSDESHTRKTRSLLAAGNFADDGPDCQKLNCATCYSEDFPVIFNIVLWISVVLLFSLVFTVAFICDMDPGRDSIIYRMTSQRMKKDA